MISRLKHFWKKSAATNQTIVLMYHRVADLSADPWEIAVSPPNFERQIQFLKRRYRVIPVSEVVENLTEKNISPDTVCITFDDGYADNYSTAKLILEKYECPAAFFVATDYVANPRNFWWDALENVVLKQEKLPQKFSAKIGGERFELDLKTDAILTGRQKMKQRKWIWHQKPPNYRCALFLAVYERLICLNRNDLQAALDEIKHWANYDETDETSFPMNAEKLKEIAADSLFEIGTHTANHTALSFQPTEIQLAEIAESRKWLLENCGKQPKILAYPNGRFDAATVSIAANQNLTAALTTEEKAVTNSSERFRLGRFQVKNWNEKQFGGQIAKWTKKER